MTKPHLRVGALAAVRRCHPWTVDVSPRAVRDGERLGQGHGWCVVRPIVGEIAPGRDGRNVRDRSWSPAGDPIGGVVDVRQDPDRRVLGG